LCSICLLSYERVCYIGSGITLSWLLTLGNGDESVRGHTLYRILKFLCNFEH
jgi:hypothetical protein